MDDWTVVVKISIRGERWTPRLIAKALQDFFLRFDVNETKTEFVGGDPDDVEDVKRVLMLG